MTQPGRTRDLIAAAALVAAGVWFTVLWALSPPAVVSFDIYEYYLPNILYTLNRLHEGGSGLLWNAYQHCGQPFFGISSTGVFYPFNVLYLVLDADLALRIVTVLNFSVAGIGMYALGRQLEAGRGAALVGAVAFELGTATVDLSTWGPQMSGPWVWLPTAMLFCERLLRTPRLSDVVGLGAALALALLPGFPQVVFFTYQLIALRILFELATQRDQRSWRAAGAVGLGLLLAPLLVAFALVPAIEMARLGVRGGRLTIDEIRAGGFLTWAQLRNYISIRVDLFNPFVLIPCVVAGASWVRHPTRRVAIFYTLAGGLYFALGLGPATPLFDLYLNLPLGGLFREPMRFLWMTSFCLAVLAALGADALVTQPERPRWWKRCAPVATTSAALVGVYFLSSVGLHPSEWILGGGVVAAAVLGGFGRAWRRIALALVVAGPVINLLGFRVPALPPALAGPRLIPIRRLLPDDQLYFKRADIFAFLRGRMTAQDRIFIIHNHPGFTLMPKSAALFGVPSVQDYEPQPSRRSAEYIVQMRSGGAMTNLNQYYVALSPKVNPWFRKPLLDLAAVRYVVVDAEVDNTAEVLSPPLYPLTLSDDLGVVVYENQQALPRALWVPQARVVPNPNDILSRLAQGRGPHRSVLLEEPPPSGFLGEDVDAGAGSAEFVVDEPEHVVVRVSAPARGFLDLADQYFPGWYATVNGAPAPILRANFLFRAVEVPAGESTVDFRYAPVSVRAGIATTAGTLLMLAIATMRRRRMRRARTSAAA